MTNTVRIIPKSEFTGYVRDGTTWVAVEDSVILTEGDPRDLIKKYPQARVNIEMVWSWEGIPPDSDYYPAATLPAQDGIGTREDDDY